MANTDMIHETFELYLKKAKECHNAKNYSQAKKFYVMAAEQMVKLAKESKGDMQTVRYQRAKNIMETARSLDAYITKAPVAKTPLNDEPKTVANERVTLEEALANLNALEGLAAVKKYVVSWVDQVKVFEMRKQRGLPVPPMSYHMVFTGNPGTGKTTVARIMAQIYCALGVISSGHLVEVERSKLVAGFVGQTAIKTQEVIQSAIGGVLFIDEAYSLVNGGDNDFGKESIDTLLKNMEDQRDDLVVIVAGYEEPMESFIAANQGLRSRFKNFINFEDYNGEELLRIFNAFCKNSGYSLTKDASSMVAQYLNYLYETRDDEFANGRDARNFFEDIVTMQSGRVVTLDSPTDEEMSTITIEDVAQITSKRSGFKYKEGAAQKLAPPQAARGNFELQNEGDALEGEFEFTWNNIPEVSFNDVAGLEEVKDAVMMKVIYPLTNPDAFEGYVKKNGGGLLLYGPPGTGKTMIAAAIANEIGAKFCSVKPSDLLKQGLGQSEKAVKDLFSQARRFPCSVIYFDEMDSISPKNTRSQYAKQLRSEFLAQLQGIDSYGSENGNILFLIASTNKPWDIDSAFIRPGRFGTRVYVGLPDATAREHIIRSRMTKIEKKGVVTVSSDIPYDVIVERSEGFNCSDISNLMDKVEEISIRRRLKTGEKIILAEDFALALEGFASSVQEEDLEKLAEWTNENN